MREVAERLGVGRAEIGAQGALALALLTSYFLLPTYQLTSTIYFQSVNGLGLEIDFMGHRTHLLLASSLASATMFAISGLAPIFWRSKYSLYLSTLAASLGTSLTFSTLVFRERYFSYNGFSILPTVDGAFYVRVPLTQELGPPLYLSAVLLGLTVMNSWTGGRWIPWGKEPLIDRVVSQVVRGDFVNALRRLAHEMGAEIEELEEGRLVVNGLEVTRSSPNLRSVDFFFPRSRGRETLLLGKERAILLDRRGVKVMSVERAVKHLASRMLETEVSKREAVRSEAESP